MSLLPRISRPALLVLEVLLDESTWTYGYELTRATGVPAGTLYPLLIRLTDAGWLTAKWEDHGERGRPPRHLYRLSADGRRGARAYLDRAASRGWATGLEGESA
jgi:DNA-binding PadR family transcriptional regulator